MAKKISPFDVYKTSTIAEATLGDRFALSDGREFVYAKAGAVALNSGELCQSPAVVANHENLVVQAIASVGDKRVVVTLGATAVTGNEYAGGYLVVNDDAGEGVAYEISGHPEAAAAANVQITLKSGLTKALAVTSEVSFIPNPGNGVIVNPTTPTSTPAGVPLVDVVAENYCFLQVAGPCSVLADGAVGAGIGVTASGAVAGAVAIATATGPQIGRTVQALVDTEYRTVHLSL